MITKANILAYGTVFKWAAVLVGFGGISALFVKEAKRDFSASKESSHPIEI